MDELIATIKLIKSTDFKVEDGNIDFHRHVQLLFQRDILLANFAAKCAGRRSASDFMDSLPGGSAERGTW